MNYTLRPAIDSDLEWLDPFYEELMRPYVELTHQWNKTKFRDSFSTAHIQIIQLDSQDIGMLKVEKREHYLYLGDIQIKQEFQRQGIGSVIVNDLIHEAESLSCSIHLRVLKGNPAKELYQRLGFRVFNELDNSYEMEYAV